MSPRHAIIDWNDRLKLGIVIVDRQHERLVELTNNLHLACLRSPDTANRFFITATHEAVEYVNYHFTTEEKLMIFLKYPGYQRHRTEHQSFVKEVLRQSSMFTTGRNFIPNRFVQFLKEWVLSHIAVEDKAMVDYILRLKHHDKLLQIFSKPANS